MQGLMVGFDVVQPDDVEEAIQALAGRGPDTKVLAGGTDLLIGLRFGALKPRSVVDLAHVSTLRGLALDDEGGLRIGAMATVTEVERSPDVAALFPALVEPAERLGSRQIRNAATVAGNICHSSPSAEFTPPLIALGASGVIRSQKGERTVPIEDFTQGPNKNVLEHSDLLTEIRVPPPEPRTGVAYDCLKIRKIMDIAVVCAAAMVRLDESGRVCEDVRLALGAVAAAPFRARRAEALLRGQDLGDDEQLLERAAAEAGAEAQPITDVRASKEYREAMTVRSALRALRVAIERAGERAV